MSSTTTAPRQRKKRTKHTQLWRSNPDDPNNQNKMLCNACGLWIKEKGLPRPVDYPQRASSRRTPPRTPSDTPSPAPSVTTESEKDELENDDDLEVSPRPAKKSRGADKATPPKAKTAAAKPATRATRQKRRRPAARASSPVTDYATDTQSVVSVGSVASDTSAQSVDSADDLAAADVLVSLGLSRTTPTKCSTCDSLINGGHHCGGFLNSQFHAVNFSYYSNGYTPAWMSPTPPRAGSSSRTYTTPHQAHYQATQSAPPAYDTGASSYATPQSILSTPDLTTRVLPSPPMQPADWYFGAGLAAGPPPLARPQTATHYPVHSSSSSHSSAHSSAHSSSGCFGSRYPNCCGPKEGSRL
ncbi:hypothetical protein Q8F55_003023 [Vanrija albida]|uniref:GATA-type domain-containing protein n=1 Tax=Vanrija albida TaxID=181172 RepID=A0ABR3QBF2_9TREE